MNKREQFIKHARTRYSSSPIEFTDEELDVIEKNDYECTNCHESVFELYDYPVIRDGDVYCEDCYCDEYQEICPVCEEHYDPSDDMDEYFFITKRTAEITGKPVGMYHVLKHPFFWGDCVVGFEAFYDDAIEQINSFDVEAYFESLYHATYQHVATEIICPECAKKYLEIASKIKEE